jgi:hypothetical protein
MSDSTELHRVLHENALRERAVAARAAAQAIIDEIDGRSGVPAPVGDLDSQRLNAAGEIPTRRGLRR